MDGTSKLGAQIPAPEAGDERPEEHRESPPKDLDARLEELGVSASDTRPVQMPALGMARVVSLLADGFVELQIGGQLQHASVDATVHPAVLRTAFDRGEPVLVEQRATSLVVVGALRTQPTPGVDAMSVVTIEADRIELKAREDITLASGAAAIALRAIGEVETFADRIVSRAESVHKIIGRMLRLN